MRLAAASRAAVVTAVLSTLLHGPPGFAAFHIAVIDEVMSGAGANASLQYVEIRMLAGGQNLVGKTRLTLFSCAPGNPASVLLLVPANVPNGIAGHRWIMASPDAATFMSAAGISPDFAFAGGLPPDCGMVCWGAPGIVPPADPNSWDPANPDNYVDCVAYGGYSGPKPSATPVEETSDTPGGGTFSLTRMGDFAPASFAPACPTPTNNADTMGGFGPCTPGTTTTTMPAASTTTSTTTGSTTTSSATSTTTMTSPTTTSSTSTTTTNASTSTSRPSSTTSTLTTTSTTTSQRATPTSTLPATDCIPEPIGPSFRALDCRLDNLIARIQSSTDIKRHQARLLAQLAIARERKMEAEDLCRSSDANTARKRLTQAIRKMIKFGRRLRSSSARRSLRAAFRADLIAAGNGIRTDMKILRSSLRCPGDALGS